jgi:hypothetical protein
MYIRKVLDILAQDAGVFDENLSNRIITVANDTLTIEKSLAEVSESNTIHLIQ